MLGQASATSLIGNIVGAVVTRLVGALLLEQSDEWAVQRARYMTLETIATLGSRLKATPLAQALDIHRASFCWASPLPA